MFVDFLIIVVKVALVVFALLNLAGFLTWAERKQSAVMQDRVGPNRAHLGRLTLMGLLHPVADGIKMVAKEDFIPTGANRFLHTLAPAAALFPALVVFAVIPFGDRVQLFGRDISLQVAQLNVGVIYIFAVSSLAVYGTMLAGWASNNNYSLLGGLRASSQMISYELSMGLSIVGILMIYQSAQLDVIVQQQGELLWGFLPKWGIVLQPLAFVLFLGAALAENKRVPFDLPEGESEIIGYFVEYSSMKFGMFFLAEFVEIIVVSGLTTTLFFGGWQVPYLQMASFKFTEQSLDNLRENGLPNEILEKLNALEDQKLDTEGKFLEAVKQEIGSDQTVRYKELILKDALQVSGFHWPLGLGVWQLPQKLVTLMQVGTFCLKVLVGCWVLLLIRWSLPRFRYDQVMRLGWKMWLPLALINLFITAVVVLLVI
ncbi:NAD(P)H-quinone oxidoreductase subunit 1, chloroplastic [Candidatus Entotheonellaceae bacterium PAL068K]